MKFGKYLSCAAAFAALFSGPALAADTCWTSSEVEAAQVRDFETMLMVATLRCQIKGVDLASDYNQFIRDKRATLTSINDELRGHFSQTMRGPAALNAYDNFVTSIANSHGAGTAGLSCQDFQQMVQTAVASATSRDALVAIARDVGMDPVLPAGRCQPRIAMAK